MWRSRVDDELSEAGSDARLVTETLEGIAIAPLYTGENAPPGFENPSPVAGVWPSRRGVGPAASRTGGWLRCPRYDDPNPDAIRRQLEADQEGGVTAAWLQLDRAGRLGEEPADPTSTDYADGASVCDVASLERALGSRSLARTALILDVGANALPAAAIVLALTARLGLDPAETRYLFSADPLAALCRDGELPASLKEVQREMCHLALHCEAYLPSSRAFTVSTLPYHDAGADAVQELGWSMATGVHYLRCLEGAGLEPGGGARQIGFRFAVGGDLFIEIAKLRAARILWTEVLQLCGVEQAEAAWLHAVSSHRTMSRRDPWMNILRVTHQLFAAIVGGADVITGAAFDAPLGRPGSSSRRLERNSLAILDEESHLGWVLDPAGGSYYVEWLTRELCRAAWRELREIERRGGMAACLLSGEIRLRVDNAWQKRRSRLEHRRETVTGVSRFADPSERPLTRAGRLERTRSTPEAGSPRGRGGNGESKIPIELGDNEYLEGLVAAAEGGASLGELSRALGRSQPTSDRIEKFPTRQSAAIYEVLRDNADRLATEGDRPTVFLAGFGPSSVHREAATFARNLLWAGGFRVVDHTATTEAEETTPGGLARAFSASEARLVCLAVGDVSEGSALADAVRPLRAAGAARIVLAGQAREAETELREAGVDAFISEGTNVYRILVDLQQAAAGGAGGAT